jgi:hypothetical protein
VDNALTRAELEYNPEPLRSTLARMIDEETTRVTRRASI